MLGLRGAVYGSEVPKTQEVYPEVQVRIPVLSPELSRVLQEPLEFRLVKVCQVLINNTTFTSDT
jgi:hypothetical protein